jgi:hypothetical protein
MSGWRTFYCITSCPAPSRPATSTTATPPRPWRGTITINPTAGAGVVAPRDLDAENGVVHEVSVVLIP